MKNGRRIIAGIGLLLLIGMYVMTFVCAILARPETPGMFIGCIAMTIILPVLLYCALTMAKMRDGKRDEEMSYSELRAYNRRLKKGEDPEKLAAEIERKYQKKEEK